MTATDSTSVSKRQHLIPLSATLGRSTVRTFAGTKTENMGFHDCQLLTGRESAEDMMCSVRCDEDSVKITMKGRFRIIRTKIRCIGHVDEGLEFKAIPEKRSSSEDTSLTIKVSGKYSGRIPLAKCILALVVETAPVRRIRNKLQPNA